MLDLNKIASKSEPSSYTPPSPKNNVPSRESFGNVLENFQARYGKKSEPIREVKKQLDKDTSI